MHKSTNTALPAAQDVNKQIYEKTVEIQQSARQDAPKLSGRMQMSQMRSFFVGSLAATALLATPAAHAADFYQGKTVNVIVGFTPGGGYDAYARILAQFIGNHIPGKPNVIVQNMPGAGSLTAVRSLDATQPKDGTAMVIFNPGIVTQSIVQPEAVDLDFRKITWIGVTTPDFRVCYGYGDKGIKSWDELMGGKQFIIGSTAKGSGNYINGATLRIVFKAPVKQILGFPGSAEQRIAIEQGELDGDCGSFSSIPPEWVRDGKAHMFVRFASQRPPEIPESAIFIEDKANAQQKQLLDVLDAADEVGRPFVMSRQVPADRIAIMRKAFDDTMKDPEFLAAAKKAQLPINPMTGQDSEAIVNKLVNAPPDVVKQAKEIYE
jgi:tripartite-type tricarboxylate transporter receptor subunit TctC